MSREAANSDLIGEKLTPQCLSCGYDLRGTLSDQCPECGVKFDAETNARLTQVPTVSEPNITVVLLLYPLVSPVVVFVPAALGGIVLGLVMFVCFQNPMLSRMTGFGFVLFCMVWLAGILARDLARQKHRFLRFHSDYISGDSEPIRAGLYFAWLLFGSLFFTFLLCLPFLL